MPVRTLSIVLALATLAGCANYSEEYKGLGDKEKKGMIDQMYSEYRESFPEAPEMTVEDLLPLLRGKAPVLLDVREAREVEVSVIPGAVLQADFEKNPAEYKGRTVVVYCTIGISSGFYTRKLKEKGVDAYNLAGGILAWVHAGQTLECQGAVTRRVHVYGEKWNLVPEGFEGVW